MIQPLFIARFGALPVEEMDLLRAPKTCAALRRLDELNATVEARRVRLDAAFYGYIGAIADKQERNRQLALRRKLLSGRAVDAPALEALPAGVLNELAPFQSAVDDAAAGAAAYQHAYDDELSAARRQLQSLGRHPAVANGVLLSSYALHSGLRRLAAADPTHFDSRDEQIELGLLRYVTRTAMKATPFSTFCVVTTGRFSNAERAESFAFDGDIGHTTSIVRLNKAYGRTLWKHLKERPAVRRRLRPELNPTLDVRESRWSWFTSTRDKETFRKLASSPGLELIAETLQRSTSTFEDLVRSLADDPNVDATFETAWAYVDRLFEAGLLCSRAIIPEQSADWDQPLVDFLAATNDDVAMDVASTLRVLRAQLESIATDVESRARILVEMRATLDSALQSAGATQRVGERSIVVYEDTTAAATLSVARSVSLDAAFETLERYATLGRRISWQRREQAALRRFFETKYGVNTAPIPLLRFYEDHERRRAERRNDPVAETEIDFVERSRAAETAFTELFATRWRQDPNAEEIDVSEDEALEAVHAVPEDSLTRLSEAVMCQIVGTSRTDQRLLVAHGRILLGHGKWFSRFLDLVGPELSNQVLEANAGLPGEMLAEIGDDAQFNANLHPALVPYTISYPMADLTDEQHRFRCADIVVRIDPNDDHALMLSHEPTQARVWPLDLGFLTPAARPPLFQLMALFSPGRGFQPGFPEEPSGSADSKPDVRYRPRLTYGNRLVLSRRRWTVQKTAFPMRDKHESRAAHFRRVQSWRAEHAIPERVYARRHQGQKPQYVDFSSPQLVELFSKMPAGADEYEVVVEEQYPDSTTLPARRGRHFAYELVVQFDRRRGESDRGDA